MMKIAFICTEKLPVPPIAGGAIQLYIDGIVPYLCKEHDITVISIKYPGLSEDELKDGVRYIRVPAKSAVQYISNIKKYLAEANAFDLVHIFNRPKWVLEIGRDYPNIKLSLSLHNEMFHSEKISDLDAAECVERVEFINTVSAFIADGVKKRVPSAEPKLHVVYSGADLEKYKPNWTQEGIQNKLQLKEKYGLEGYKIILFIGRLSVKKGVHVLMQAVKRVMEEHENVAFVIVGSKWYGKNETDEYTVSLEQTSRSLGGPIIFTGFLPPSQVPAYYNLGDIFVCSSQWNEPLARVHYEAMAAGLPIITTNRGGNAEVIKPDVNGMIVHSCSKPEEFVESIDYLLKNPEEAEKLGRNGRKMAEEKYNWERVAGEVLQPIDSQVVINEVRKEAKTEQKETKQTERKASEREIKEKFNWERVVGEVLQPIDSRVVIKEARKEAKQKERKEVKQTERKASEREVIVLKKDKDGFVILDF